MGFCGKGEIIAAGVTTTGIETVAAGTKTVMGVLHADPEVTCATQVLGTGFNSKDDSTNISHLTKGVLGSLEMVSIISSDVSATSGCIDGVIQ